MGWGGGWRSLFIICGDVIRIKAAYYDDQRSVVEMEAIHSGPRAPLNSALSIWL